MFADEEKSRRARVLHVIIWSILLVVNVQIISLVFAQPEHLVRWAACVLAIDLTLPVLLVLSRRGHFQLAGGLLVGMLWVLVTAMALTAGGVHAPIIMANLVIVLVVGLLFGEGAGVIAAVVFSLTGLVFVWLEKERHLPASNVIATAPTLWVTQTLFIALVASFQFLANRSIKDALGQARRELEERKRAEAELGEKEERFREVYETTSDYIFLVDVTPEGKFHYYSWNPTCARQAGFSSEQLRGKTPEDLFPPDQARNVSANYRRCIEQNATISYEEFLKMGPQSHDFHTTLIPVRNPAGRVHRIVGVAHNITEQKKAEAELRESEERYRIVVEQTGQLVYELDVSSGKLSWRGAIERLTGFGVQEFQEVNIVRWEEMIHPEDRPAAMEAFNKAMAEVGEYHVEYRFRCKNGNYIDIEDHGLFLPDHSGRSHRMLGAMADITDRKRAEKALMQSRDELEKRVQERTMELQKANKELEAFTYSVSHDLRSPVRVVESFADLLIEDYAKQMPEEAQQFLGEIKTGAQRMSGLIQGLLRLSNVDREPFAPRCVNLTELVNEVVAELRREQKGREMEIRVDKLPDCLGDPALLRQFFVNLLSNAIKFTGTRPKALIEVGCKEKGEKPVCFVKDNGVGFDMQKADKLFGVFQRLHSPDEFAGTGVGLSIVQRIIHRHGGRIWAESEVDRGTTFYFTLPRCEGANPE